MKSMFSVIGLCYAIGLLVAMLFIDFSLFVLCIICIVFIIISIFYKAENKKSILVGLLCICSGIFIYNIFYIQNVKPVQVLCDNTAEVFATVKEKSYTENGKCMYTLETSTINIDDLKIDCPQNIKVRIVTKSDFYAEQYEKVKLNLKFSAIPNSAYKVHNISKGLYINAVITSYEYEIYVEKDIPWYNFIDDIKNSIKNKLSENLSTNQSNLLFALLVGDTTDIDKTIISNFRNSGLSHILVISGLHLSVITSFIFGFLSLIFRTKNKSIPALITIIFLLLYMCFTGFSYSVMRSTIMNVIYLFSYVIHKKPNPINSLGIAIIIITLINPFSIGNISFQMSVMATLGIILLQKRINKSLLLFIPKRLRESKFDFIYKFLNFITSVISVSVSATIFTLPITIFIFEKFSIYFIISNLFVTTLAPFVLSVGIIMLVVSYLPFLNCLNFIIGFIERALCQFILWVSKTVSNLPYSVIDISSIYIKIAVVAIVLTLAIFFIFSGFKIKDLKYCTIICCSISAMILSIGYFVDFESLYFYIEPTGSGITVVEKSNSGVNILLCGGDNYHFNNVSNFLFDKNINSMNIIGNKAYYNKYAENINENFDVKSFIFCGDKSEYTNDFSGEVNGIFIDRNSKINYNKYSLEIISIDDEDFVYLMCKGGKIIISPKNGDFKKLPDKYRNVDIAIVQSGCKNQNLITAKKVVVCGKQKTADIPNGYYYTGNGEIILYSLFKNEVKLWQG